MNKKKTRNPEIQNRKASHDYHVLETVEAGVCLQGTEVKSLRSGRANIGDAFARVDKGELWLHNCHIQEYEQGNRQNHEPTRLRKLLVHKSELRKLNAEVMQNGCTLIPLKGYFKQGLFKLLVGVCKGKAAPDKRQDVKKKELDREARRAMQRRR